MTRSGRLKETVKNKYAQISEQSRETSTAFCCGFGRGCSTVDCSIFADDYSSIKGYNEDADLGLGCGLPTEYAWIKKRTPSWIWAQELGTTAL